MDVASTDDNTNDASIEPPATPCSSTPSMNENNSNVNFNVNVNQKSNKNLTHDEKEAKRNLKKELKRKRIQASLDRRLRHAVAFRKDPIAAQQTRDKLAALLGSNGNTTMSTTSASESTTIIAIDTDTCPHEQAARDFVLQIYVGMKQRHLSHDGRGSKQSKQLQTNHAVHLLRHMTKGTQHKGMFDNTDALWGYARQKFQERAMLVFKSFANLDQSKQRTMHQEQSSSPSSVSVSAAASNSKADEEVTKRKRAWKSLARIRSVCSIGCGPGCDAVGVLAFLHTFFKQQQPLESIVLMDWAMEKWKTVVDVLEPVLVPHWVTTVECTSGDVTQSLAHPSNCRLSPLMVAQVDLFLFSYILTETRGKWETFVRDLVTAAKSNTLFYFAEPTPWQLHHLRTHVFPSATTNTLPTTPHGSVGHASTSRMDDASVVSLLEYIWIDSSMNQSVTIQAMDGRLGPGVLLARKL